MMAYAIEAAGFEVRDCCGYLFGSGFPKSHNIGNGFGTALKPGNGINLRRPQSRYPEPTIAANALEMRERGALNIDKCRIKTENQWEQNCIATVLHLSRLRQSQHSD